LGQRAQVALGRAAPDPLPHRHQPKDTLPLQRFFYDCALWGLGGAVPRSKWQTSAGGIWLDMALTLAVEQDRGEIAALLLDAGAKPQ
jgi:hypothetical protein